MKLARNMQKYL